MGRDAPLLFFVDRLPVSPSLVGGQPVGKTPPPTRRKSIGETRLLPPLAGRGFALGAVGYRWRVRIIETKSKSKRELRLDK